MTGAEKGNNVVTFPHQDDRRAAREFVRENYGEHLGTFDQIVAEVRRRLQRDAPAR